MNNQTAFLLAWEFMKNNWKLTVLTILIEIALIVLGFVPILGVFFSLLLSLVIFNEQIYFGKAVLLSKANVEKIREISKQTSLSKFLFEYIGIAIGSYLGFFIVLLIIGIVAAILMNFGIYDNYGQVTITPLGYFLLLIIAVYLGIISYIAPAVMGEVLKSNDFSEAFKRVFLVFNWNFWKKSFNKDYFIFVFLWSLIMFGLLIIGEILVISVVLSPIGILIFYFLGLYDGAAFVFASELLEKNSKIEETEEKENMEESQD
jgi:hypothetical protein